MSNLLRSKRVQSDFPNSRYGTVDEIREGSSVYLDLMNLSEIPFSSSDLYFTVTRNEADRLDKVSYLFYKTVNLYWLIAHANRILDPLDVPVGTILRIPSLSVLYGQNGLLL